MVMPKKKEEDKKKNISVSFEEDLLSKIEESGENRSRLINNLLREYFQKDEQVNIDNKIQENYVKDSDYLLTLEEWVEMIEDGCIIDDDGHGYYTKNGLITDKNVDFYLTNEDLVELKSYYNGVVWYNK